MQLKPVEIRNQPERNYHTVQMTLPMYLIADPSLARLKLFVPPVDCNLRCQHPLSDLYQGRLGQSIVAVKVPRGSGDVCDKKSKIIFFSFLEHS